MKLEKTLIDEFEASERYNVCVFWFRAARELKFGPPFIKRDGMKAMYDIQDADRYFKGKTEITKDKPRRNSI